MGRLILQQPLELGGTEAALLIGDLLQEEIWLLNSFCVWGWVAGRSRSIWPLRPLGLRGGRLNSQIERLRLCGRGGSVHCVYLSLFPVAGRFPSDRPCFPARH